MTCIGPMLQAAMGPQHIPRNHAMWIDTNSARLLLKPQQPLRLQHAQGTRLRAVQGTVWITIDNDRRDIVLNAGDAFVVDSSQGVVALPIGERALLDMCAAGESAAAVPAGPAQPTRITRLQDQLRGWLHGLAGTPSPA